MRGETRIEGEVREKGEEKLPREGYKGDVRMLGLKGDSLRIM